MKAAGFNFVDGPHRVDTSFAEVPGVYLITDCNNQPIDCGETGNLCQRMNSHERKDSWYQCAHGQQPLLYFLSESDGTRRLQIESIIRTSYPFVCGVR